MSHHHLELLQPQECALNVVQQHMVYAQQVAGGHFSLQVLGSARGYDVQGSQDLTSKLVGNEVSLVAKATTPAKPFLQMPQR